MKNNREVNKYAGAVFAVAEGSGQLSDVSQHLNTLLTAYKTSQDLRLFLQSRRIPLGNKFKILKVVLEDVLSEFVGDLPDEHDQRFSGIRRLGPGQWRIDGKTDIDDFEEFFGLEPNVKDVATVGGLFLSHSEQLPNEGEKITIDGLEITVLDIEGRRIDSVVVKKIAKK